MWYARGRRERVEKTERREGRGGWVVEDLRREWKRARRLKASSRFYSLVLVDKWKRGETHRKVKILGCVLGAEGV